MDILKYEAMAKLQLPEEERQWVAGQAENLLQSFAALDAIDTDGIEPLITVPDIQNILRDDVSKKLISRDELLSNAPEQYDGYFQVPRTID